jgi:adenosyl cobinamide kinase/adenosyl cobinamide phosphate guanylyltransferase
MPLTLLIGGARSGKSSLALRLAEGEVVFIATAEAGDAEMAERIDAHRAERPASWQTVEAPIDLAGALRDAPPDACVIVDCLTLWVANTMDEERAREAAALAASRPGRTIVVTNEVGLGIVPANDLARAYRDLLGRVNAIWAEAADRVLLVVAGRTLELT